MRVYGTVYGRVQGVGFRYFAKAQADKHNLTGYVRNKPNGAVELELEGSEQQIKLFMNQLKKGLNPFIKVEKVELQTLAADMGYKEFQIKY